MRSPKLMECQNGHCHDYNVAGVEECITCHYDDPFESEIRKHIEWEFEAPFSRGRSFLGLSTSHKVAFDYCECSSAYYSHAGGWFVIRIVYGATSLDDISQLCRQIKSHPEYHPPINKIEHQVGVPWSDFVIKYSYLEDVD